MADILRKIVDNKRREVEAAARLGLPSSGIAKCGTRSMSRALADSRTGIIAEFKRRSPSKGDIHPMAMVNDVIPSYTEAGASACSILTDTPYFGGALTDLAVARQLTKIPLLRKDFIVSEFQIEEAAIYGADAILLIASALHRDEIERFTSCAHALGLEVLLELHSIEELDKFYPEVEMAGINNRNLSTFHTDPTLSLSLAKELPDNVVKVAESGLTSIEEINRLRDAGYRGFLIGETFMRHSNPGKALHQFLNPCQHTIMITKICGLADPDNIKDIARLKPSMMGFIFYAPSPRNACALLPSVVNALPDDIERTGVFVDMPIDHIVHTASRYGLTTVQLHGKETPDMCRSLREAGLKVMKAVGVDKDINWDAIRPYENNVDMLVLDTLTAIHGGSGRKFDWNLLRDYPLSIPFLLSGGISPDDADAIKEAASVLPLMAGIDINSRFETRPGLKDTSIVAGFLSSING